MNLNRFRKLTDQFIDKIKEVREDGQKEYARDQDNVFANFERVAKDLGIKREEVLLTYMLKHKDGIVSWVRGHKSQREDVRGRIKDHIVYLLLLWGMVEEDYRNELLHDKLEYDYIQDVKAECQAQEEEEDDESYEIPKFEIKGFDSKTGNSTNENV